MPWLSGILTFLTSSRLFILFANHESEKVKLNQDELVDYARVTLEEAKNYDLIENIYEQIEKCRKRA